MVWVVPSSGSVCHGVRRDGAAGGDGARPGGMRWAETGVGQDVELCCQGVAASSKKGQNAVVAIAVHW